MRLKRLQKFVLNPNRGWLQVCVFSSWMIVTHSCGHGLVTTAALMIDSSAREENIQPDSFAS